MDGTYIGVIDRIVDGETAVILVEDEGEVVEQFDVAVKELPDDAAERAVLEIEVDSDDLVSIEFLREETESRQEAAQDRFDRLSKRFPDS